MKRKIDSNSVQVDESNQIDHQAAHEDDKSSSNPPSYGSQLYWETRYKTFFDTCHAAQENQDANEASAVQNQSIIHVKEAPEPGHPWYFTYDELKPLLFPLVIMNNITQQRIEKPSTQEGLLLKTENHDTQDIYTKHVQCHGSTNILEIGCGDVPLGIDLFRDIQRHYQETTACETNYRITCFDYSASVIQHLNTRLELEKEIFNKALIHLEFKVHDATDLPYKDNVFSVIIDKGTIDARMSDMDSGCNDCVKMVYEAARLLIHEGTFTCMTF